MNAPHDELELRRHLRQLARERAPQRDLWLGIEARLDTAPQTTHVAPRRQWLGLALAAAAVLALALGVVWRPALTPTGDAPMASSAPDSPATQAGDLMLRREAEAVTLEYRLAIDSLADQPLPPELQAATAELDASAEQLRQALREQPEATYLLERLRRTYDQRLKLTQRVVVG